MSLTDVQQQTLAFIRENGGRARAPEIARHFGITPQGAERRIAALVRSGHLVRLAMGGVALANAAPVDGRTSEEIEREAQARTLDLLRGHYDGSDCMPTIQQIARWTGTTPTVAYRRVRTLFREGALVQTPPGRMQWRALRLAAAPGSASGQRPGNVRAEKPDHVLNAQAAQAILDELSAPEVLRGADALEAIVGVERATKFLARAPGAGPGHPQIVAGLTRLERALSSTVDEVRRLRALVARESPAAGAAESVAKPVANGTPSSNGAPLA